MIFFFNPFQVILGACIWVAICTFLAKATWHDGFMGPFVLSAVFGSLAAFVGLRMAWRTLAALRRALFGR